ncbi:hypothetical protein JMJ78_0009796 [Colletotrichum scovillei]|nr:hypothetical protein JMJ78_0009796 [Colletotrichum scovillei]
MRLLVGAELKELAVVLDDELMTETLLVGVPMVEVDIKVAALTVGLDELDEDDVVPTEELLVALGEELVVALEDEDETVERLLVEALLVIGRSVAALTVGLDEEDEEGEEDVLERLLVVIVLLLVETPVDELADELEEDGELLAELLEGATVELVLDDSKVDGLTVALMDEVALGTVLLIVESTLDVGIEDDDGLLADVLEGDPAALLVVGSSVAALAVGLSDAKLLSELLLDAGPLEGELELIAELEDGEELLLEEVEDVLATLAVTKVLEEPTELELDNSVVLVVDDDDGVNDVDNKDAGSTLRLDVDEVTVEEALERSLELLWKSWLEPLLEVDEDITVDSDEDSDVEPDERSSELDEALVEDALVVGSKVLSSAVLAVVDDVKLAMLEDGSEGLLELKLEVEDDGGESELEDELVEAALVLDSKVFGSTASVVLVEVALAPVDDVLGSGSKVEELESIELDNPGERSVDVDLEVEDEVDGVTSGAVVEVGDDEDVGKGVLVVLADDDSDRVVEVSALIVALEDAGVKEAEDESKVELEIVIVIPAVELTKDVDKLEENDSELETKLAGSIDGRLEDRDSPIEVDDEESEKLDAASTELSELDSDEELRSEIDEEREDVKSVVGNSVNVETRLAGSMVGDEDGDVVVVTNEDIDVTDAASSELDWGVEEVVMTAEVSIGEDTEDSVKLTIELDGDR